ncbi:MAG: hypothetical protein EBV86_17475 [Marivivens sp.]|nr:hypothetical protein [Marivivens sp.]
MGEALYAATPIAAKGAISLLGSLFGKPTEADLVEANVAHGKAQAEMGFDSLTSAPDPVADRRPYGDPSLQPYGDPYNAPAIPAAPVDYTNYGTDIVGSVIAPLTLDEIVKGATQTGLPRFITTAAQGGGISSLAYGGDPSPMGFANQAFEGMVPGQGTGMSDSVPFSIEGQQPALLSRDEYVLPADVVSQLGDGSSGAGADMLDNFVSRVRQNKYGNTQQPPANGMGLIGGLMRSGGVV